MAGRHHLGIIDADKKAFLFERDKAEEQLAGMISWAKTEEANNIYVSNEENIAYVTAEMQLGTPMMYTEFERLLKRLPCGPHLVFKEHSLRPFRAVYYMTPMGKLDYISAYGRTVLPEFSTMSLKSETVRNFNVRHIDRKDMPAMRFNPALGRIGGYEQVNPNDLRPGWENVNKFWGENADDPMSRGYRTVLTRLVPKYATPAEIESIFGASNKRSWAVGMGKQNLPYKF